MLNVKLIEAAVKLVLEYNEAEHIIESSKTIFERAAEWYNNSEIVEPQMLAAVTLYGRYQPISWQEVLSITDFFFPEEQYYNLYSIGEIEMAQHDCMWR